MKKIFILLIAVSFVLAFAGLLFAGPPEVGTQVTIAAVPDLCMVAGSPVLAVGEVGGATVVAERVFYSSCMETISTLTTSKTMTIVTTTTETAFGGRFSGAAQSGIGHGLTAGSSAKVEMVKNIAFV